MGTNGKRECRVKKEDWKPEKSRSEPVEMLRFSEPLYFSAS